MKYGIFFAYWEKEWYSDYKKYIDKVAELGFDVLEIQCTALRTTYTTNELLDDLKAYADEKKIMLTAGYGPTKEQNFSSSDPRVVESAINYFIN